MSSNNEGDPLDRMLEAKKAHLARLRSANDKAQALRAQVGETNYKKLAKKAQVDNSRRIVTVPVPALPEQVPTVSTPRISRRTFLLSTLAAVGTATGWLGYDRFAPPIAPGVSDRQPFSVSNQDRREVILAENILGEAHWSCPYDSFANAGVMASLIHERHLVIPPTHDDTLPSIFKGYQGPGDMHYTTLASWEKLGFVKIGPGLAYDACFTAVLAVAALQRAGKKLGLGNETKDITLDGMPAKENPLVRWFPHYKYPDIRSAFSYYPDVGNNAAVFLGPLQDIYFRNPTNTPYGIGAYYYRDENGDYKNGRGTFTIGVYVYTTPDAQFHRQKRRCPVMFRSDLFMLDGGNTHKYPALDISLGRNGAKDVDPESSYGQLIVAPRSGVVKSVNDDPNFCGTACGGRFVEILSDDGETIYLGHAKRTFVEPGRRIEAGGLVMEMGMSGQATGPHLHTEVNQGKVDPVKFGLVDTSLNFDMSTVIQFSASQ